MDKIVEQGLLYDFYGELLTGHQRKIYEHAVYDDMSLSEIADEQGISKQGVHDLIKRCTKTLQSYEDRLHMIRRFEAIKESAEELKNISDKSVNMTNDEIRENLSVISSRILEELNS